MTEENPSSTPSPASEPSISSAPTPQHRHHDDIEARIALVQLSGMGPARSRWLLAEHDPAEVVARLRAGRYPIPAEDAPPGLAARHLRQWKSDLSVLDPAALYRHQIEKGWTILSPDDPRWPFVDDPEPPLLLFCEGDVDLLAHRPSVAIVGTRRCTSVGRTVAHQLGFELGAAGVAVLSGLALGVDAAAHHGALEAGASIIGVVGTGLDVVYPRTNRSLWAEVARTGLLVSEYPAGVHPDRWRFPARNRIIAGLSDGVVIVESHARGGSLLTADEAINRGLPVMAVPGAVVNPAADGANGLIVDGATPVRHAEDVLLVIGHRPPASDQLPLPLDPPAPDRLLLDPPALQPQGGTVDPPASAAPPSSAGLADLAELLEVIRQEVGNGSVSMDRLVIVSGRSPVEVVGAVEVLARQGVVAVDGTTVSWLGAGWRD
ncbi:MAG: DNA-processing protein DprA [Acidimicrobiia bacterium]|nr:DNA-processing protein DprA [Acidimicrobiia bacterium]